MGIFDGFKRWFWRVMAPEEWAWYAGAQERLVRYEKLSNYARGIHAKQLKVKWNQQDDNIALNFVSLVIERSISLLFGKGVEFDLPGEEETEQDEYLAEVWAANHMEILLHKAAQMGSVYGTGYLKTLPGEYPSKIRPKVGLPRFVPTNPVWVTINTEPEDMERVAKYVTRFNTVDGEGKEIARKEEVTRVLSAEGVGMSDILHWKIANYADDKGRWELLDEPEIWDWPFPPMLHWQNLPNAEDVYGFSDIEDAIDIQDRINYIASNISKVIRHHAHPRTWGRGVNLPPDKTWGPDQIISVNGPDGMLANLELMGELAGSAAFMNMLRQSLMDITRTVDISSMADKIGALTNFGLRVLYQDAIAKLSTKRELYGAALTELNRRVLTMAGWDGEDADGGVVIWPETLPSNVLDDAKALQLDLDMGLVSKQTASMHQGYDWEQELERMEGEAASADNIGAALLRAFEAGG